MGAVSYPTRRWTRDEYEHLIDQGFFRPDERLELIDGEIVTMTPQNGPHITAIGLTADALQRALGGRFLVREQGPLALDAISRPEPDVAVVIGHRRDYRTNHPTPDQTRLVVEVADSTLVADRHRKAPLYAEAGIPEYWIVNLIDRVLEVYREPVALADGWNYRLIQALRSGEAIQPLAVPDTAILVADLLP